MNAELLLHEAHALFDQLVEHRRYFHRHAEVHMALPLSADYVERNLRGMGYHVRRHDSSGLSAVVGKGEGPVFLIRADMDALPIHEEGCAFASETGNMHACGHDMHAAMLLGAARLLKEHEAQLKGRVKLMFQPGEEVLAGAAMMLKSGILEDPKVDAAMMLHVMSGMSIPTGGVVFANGTPFFSASDLFHITIKGKGCHGAMPDTGVDPLNVLAHLHLALQSLNARETPPTEPMVLTIGHMGGGNAANVIPDSAFMSGTIRSYDPALRMFLHKRLLEITKGVAATFRAEAEVEFEGHGCPAMITDKALEQQVYGYVMDLLGPDKTLAMVDFPELCRSMGSEDFAFFSEQVPTLGVLLGAGHKADGHTRPLHHPQVSFDEAALPVGAAVYAYSAMRWLEDQVSAVNCFKNA